MQSHFRTLYVSNLKPIISFEMNTFECINIRLRSPFPLIYSQMIYRRVHFDLNCFIFLLVSSFIQEIQIKNFEKSV